jgi:hypothetical protein
MTEVFNLNHPWKIYFAEPTSAYTEYEIYYQELVRLYNYIKFYNEYLENLKENDVCMTILILGTPMEAAIWNKQCSEIYDFQWQQLFPKYIFDFIKHYKKLNNNININIIVVSPDNIFMDKFYREPLFTIKCEDYSFNKIKNREYIHTSDNLTIKIDIFTCPFPQLETNTKNIERHNNFIHKIIKDYKLKTFEPSEEDIKYINRFYENFERICENKKANLIINSFAVFRNVRDYDNYGLFPTLLEVANKHKIIATEWSFNERNIFVNIISKINYLINHAYFKVSYVEVAYTSLIIRDYLKINFEEIKRLKKEYDDFRKLANELCIIIKVPYKKMIYKKIIYS